MASTITSGVFADHQSPGPYRATFARQRTEVQIYSASRSGGKRESRQARNLAIAEGVDMGACRAEQRRSAYRGSWWCGVQVVGIIQTTWETWRGGTKIGQLPYFWSCRCWASTFFSNSFSAFFSWFICCSCSFCS